MLYAGANEIWLLKGFDHFGDYIEQHSEKLALAYSWLIDKASFYHVSSHRRNKRGYVSYLSKVITEVMYSHFIVSFNLDGTGVSS